MRLRTKKLGLSLLLLGVIGAGSAFIAFRSVDVRELGRSDPRQAASHLLPWRNFAETYTDGSVLGIAVGSPKAEAIRAAERAGLEVSPSGWGDSRAGGASLYDRRALVASMLAQDHLAFSDPRDLRRELILHFHGGRLSSVEVYYVKFEAL
jgi:hypothetical protein